MRERWEPEREGERGEMGGRDERRVGKISLAPNGAGSRENRASSLCNLHNFSPLYTELNAVRVSLVSSPFFENNSNLFYSHLTTSSQLFRPPHLLRGREALLSLRDHLRLRRGKLKVLEAIRGISGSPGDGRGDTGGYGSVLDARTM